MKDSKEKLAVQEYIKLAVEAIGLSFGVGFLFYDILWGVVFAPIVMAMLIKLYRRNRVEIRRTMLTDEFCEVLKIIQATLIGGYSLEHAFLEAEREIREISGDDSLMYQELQLINKQIAMNVPVEGAFLEFASRSDIEEIQTFAEVLTFAKRSGGNLIEILEGSINRIQLIRDTEREIEVLVASRKYEQKIMVILPVVILLYLKMSFKEYISVLYGNFFGIIFMSICIVLYGLAVIWERKILQVVV